MRRPSIRFGRYLQRWWEAQQQSAPSPGEWLRGRDAESIAHEFRRDAQFEVAQAAFLHRRPSDTVALGIVEGLSPQPSEKDTELLVTAIVRAGSTAQKVRATTVIGAFVTVCALVLRNILRGR